MIDLNPRLEKMYREAVETALDAGRSYYWVTTMCGVTPHIINYFHYNLHEKVPLAPADAQLQAEVTKNNKAPALFFKGIQNVSELLYKNHDELHIKNPLNHYIDAFINHPVHGFIYQAVSPGQRCGNVLQKNWMEMTENITCKSEKDGCYGYRPSIMENAQAECCHYLDCLVNEIKKERPGKLEFFIAIDDNKKKLERMTDAYKELAHAAWCHFDVK